MGVADWFSCFCGTLQVRDAGTISQRYKAITRRLNTDFWDTTSETAHSLYVGSYGRNTAIQGFSDLDMVFELPSSLYTQYHAFAGNGQSALLQAVRTSIRKTYPNSDVGAAGQVVAIPFTDGLTFEVVPVFPNTEGSYTHPDSNAGGSWRVTNPKPEIAAIRDRNTATNSNLVPLCRMMRSWKAVWAAPMGGLLIDTLAYQFIVDWVYRDKSCVYYDFMCRDFLKYMGDQDQDQVFWRAPGSGQSVCRTGRFESKALQCHNLSLQAIAYATEGKEWSAKQEWRKILGPAFPD